MKVWGTIFFLGVQRSNRRPGHQLLDLNGYSEWKCDKQEKEITLDIKSAFLFPPLPHPPKMFLIPPPPPNFSRFFVLSSFHLVTLSQPETLTQIKSSEKKKFMLHLARHQQAQAKPVLTVRKLAKTPLDYKVLGSIPATPKALRSI